MKTILLPTDFSDNSWNAIEYALNFHKESACNFYLLHVNRLSNVVTNDYPYIPSHEIIEDVYTKPAKKQLREILKKISRKQIEEDQFISSVKTEDLIEEIINSFRETSSKEINLICEEDKNRINIQRTPEIIYGFRNFIGNAVKFSKSKVSIEVKSDVKIMSIFITDDGPGFPDDVKDILGEPYIKSKSKEVSLNSGLGLGTFLGKTLLEKQGAKLFFSRDKKLGGASVVISWDINNLKSYS